MDQFFQPSLTVGVRIWEREASALSRSTGQLDELRSLRRFGILPEIPCSDRRAMEKDADGQCHARSARARGRHHS